MPTIIRGVDGVDETSVISARFVSRDSLPGKALFVACVCCRESHQTEDEGHQRPAPPKVGGGAEAQGRHHTAIRQGLNFEAITGSIASDVFYTSIPGSSEGTPAGRGGARHKSCAQGSYFFSFQHSKVTRFSNRNNPRTASIPRGTRRQSSWCRVPTLPSLSSA